jgi:hypothetical protein
VSGVDTVRGIGYQQAQAVLEAVALLDDARAAALRVEGVEDVVDVEVLGHRGQLLAGKQFKVRADEYTWGQAELVAVMRRWAAVPGAGSAVFEFVTDGRLGPSGERVRDALRAAAAAEFAELAAVLGDEENAAVVRRLARAVVRQDPVGVGALLLRAERQVMAMLPAPATAADARREAEAAVNRLFALLMERAGHPDAHRRVVDRAEIAAVLGVAPDQAAGDRWPGEVRGRYLERAAALAVDTVATPLLERVDGDGAANRGEVVGQQGRLPVVDMAKRLPALLAGRTGEGKSTACRVLVRDAAAAGRPVLLAHAEAYLPGRLAALAADALSEVLVEPMPAATGAQALADAEVTLVVDGVSEVPRALRDALAEDLRAQVASGRGAGVVVVGRDVAALRAVLPASRVPARFAVARLDRQRRLDAAHRLVTGTVPPVQPERFPAKVRTLAAGAERALGDAAGNPLLFVMAVRLLSDGVSFTDRAGMYAAFVERLAERAGAEGVAEAKRVLGVAFAQLLDEGRRYADPYEWRALVADAAAVLTADPERADQTARRSGVVTSIEYAQTVVPMHDSFADYLAGAAHAARLVPLPARLAQADEQRVAFAAQIGGVDAALAAAVARDLPLLSVAVAEHDARALDASAPAEVAALLSTFTGADAPAGVALWRDQGRVVAFADNSGEARWVDDDEALDIAQSTPHIAGGGGPLDLAVRLWRRDLRVRLTSPAALPPGRPQTVDDAVEALLAHTAATVAQLGRLLDVLPAAARPAVAAQIGPFGLTARVGRRQHGLPGDEWSAAYTHTDDIDIIAAPGDEEELNPTGWGGSSVRYMLSTPPADEAAKRVRDAVNKLVGRHWI